MDNITSRIRDMYEQFPYPAGRPANRIGNDVELALSYQNRRPESTTARQVLDAGCGRGIGILGSATLQPEVHFLGVDINRVAIAEAENAARQRGLGNVRFLESDLMQLDGINAPPDGFDIIHSSGVIHHLSAPEVGLTKLSEVLAPHGVINLMVYAKHGRTPLIQTADAIDLLLPQDMPLKDKVMPARAVAALAKHHVLAGTMFEKTFEVNDVEFVDRLLNVNETSYDIPKLWEVLEAAGLRFLRWGEPKDWAPANLLPEGHLRQWVENLSEFDQFRFIELIYRPTTLELLVCKADNELRTDLKPEDIDSTIFELNPEIVISTGVRQTQAGQRVEKLDFTLRGLDPESLASGPFASALLVLKDRQGSTLGRDLVSALQTIGTSTPDSNAIIMEMVRREILYRPWCR
ncbi:MAG: class I SAM-dependent methyltransferase [Gemmatimonadales bacterium]|nr:class I SAM-dependent methyltransferase [Gemmatimonadales bacterium]